MMDMDTDVTATTTFSVNCLVHGESTRRKFEIVVQSDFSLTDLQETVVRRMPSLAGHNLEFYNVYDTERRLDVVPALERKNLIVGQGNLTSLFGNVQPAGIHILIRGSFRLRYFDPSDASRS